MKALIRREVWSDDLIPYFIIGSNCKNKNNKFLTVVLPLGATAIQVDKIRFLYTILVQTFIRRKQKC